MTSKLTIREAMRGKLEATYNTDPTPGSSDGIQVEELQPNVFEQVVFIEPNSVKTNYQADKHRIATALAGFSCSVEVKGSGTAGVAPEASVLYQICGMAETVVASTSVTYKPVSSGFKSGAFYVYLDGVLIKITGARGTVGFTLEGQQRIMANFTVVGHRNALSDVSLVADTLSTVEGPIFQNASFAIAGYSPRAVNQFDFELGGTLHVPVDVNASDGFGEVQLMAPRRTVGSFNPEHVLVATHDFFAKAMANTDMALDTGVLGGTAGNKVQFSLPVVRYREQSFENQNGIRGLGASFEAYDSSGDDAVSLIFT